MDITTYVLLKKKIDSLGISDKKIQEVIESFLLEHPEYIGATAEQDALIKANAAAILELQADDIEILTLDEYNALPEEDKTKKNYLIWDSDSSSITIDSELNINSSNPISNKIVTKEIESIKSHILLEEDSNIINMYTLDENNTQIKNENPFLSLVGGTYERLELYGDRLVGKQVASTATFNGNGISIISRTGNAEYGSSKIQLNTSGKTIKLENGAISTTDTITSQTDFVISNATKNISLSKLSDDLNNKMNTTDIQYGTIELEYISDDILYGEKILDKDIYGATVSLVSKSDTKHLNVTNLSMNCISKTLKITATGSGFASGDTVAVSYIAII